MPSTPEPPTSITVKVKVPPGYLSTAENTSGTDFFVLGAEVPITANVGILRQQIQQTIPTHPAPERQRLLYGGRALVDNEQKLGDAFNVRRDPTQTEYVVHLLVKGEQGQGDAGPAHRRAVSTPPAHPPATNGQQHLPQTQAGQGGPPFGAPPPLHAFPHIIARNQQARAGMAMQGVGGQQAQAQAQANMAAGQNAGGGQTPQPAGQGGSNVQPGLNGAPPPPAGNNGQPQQGQPHFHPPGRPISGQGFHMQGIGPNGQRFEVHQQMMQFPMYGGPAGAMPGHMPFGFPGNPFHQMQPQAPLVQHQQQQQQTPPRGPSALDRARENMAEMRRVLEEMRAQNGTSEEQQRRIGDVQQRAESLNEYIDPLQMSNTNGTAGSGQRQVPQQPGPTNNQSTLPQPFQHGLPPLYNVPRRPMVPHAHAHHHVHPRSNPNEVTAYLLSSPQGPQALLFSPQHGTYTGSFGQNVRPQPTPTTSITATHQAPQVPQQQPDQAQQPNDPVAQAAHRAVQDLQPQHAQLQAAQANQQQAQPGQAGADGGPMQAMLGHFWLLMRVLIFAYFFLGSNMGWRRPLALAAIGLGFWLLRTGMLGDGAGVRRWWEGVVGVEGARAEQQAAANGEVGGQQQQQNGAPAPPAPAAGVEGAGQAQPPPPRPGAMPTPEQMAQRILNEQADRHRQQHAWWRERIRPVERVVAMFVASLWPGVGEATVRARREMEERERARVAEEERVRAEEEAEAERARVAAAAEGAGEGGEGEGGGKAEGEEKLEGAAAAESGAWQDMEGSEGLRERKSAVAEGQTAGTDV